MSAPLIIPLQASFTPGSTQMESFDWQFLCYSSVGGILACLDSGTPSYNVKFRDSFYTDYTFSDLRRYSLGSMSSHGALFALPIQEPHTRNDPVKLHFTEDQRAYIFYRPHNDNDSRNRWEALLPEGEDIQTIVATAKGPVITTTTGLVRYFSCFGLQYHVAMAPSSTILSSVACDQWLMHVYHIAAEPGNLRLGYTLIDLNSLTEESSGSLTLTPGGALEWIGFGEDGTPSCTDSEGLVQILLHSTSRAHWTPVLQIHPGRLFPFGLSRGKLHCLRIAADPSWISQPICQEISWKLPAAQMSHGNSELEEQLLLAQINTQLIISEDPESRSSVPLQAQHLIEDKLLLQLIHVACKANRPQQVVELSLMLNCNDSLTFAEKLASSANMTDAVNRIQEIQKLNSSKIFPVQNTEKLDDFPELFSSDEDIEDNTVLSSPHNTSPSKVISTPTVGKVHLSNTAPSNPFSVKVHKKPFSNKENKKTVQLSTPRKRHNRLTDSHDDMPSKSPFLSTRRNCSILVSPQVPASQSASIITSTPIDSRIARKLPQSKVKCQLPISDSD